MLTPSHKNLIQEPVLDYTSANWCFRKRHSSGNRIESLKWGAKQKRDLLGHDMPDFQDVMTKARSGHSGSGNSFCPSSRICKMILKG